jgi:hypothetical protein
VAVTPTTTGPIPGNRQLRLSVRTIAHVFPGPCARPAGLRSTQSGPRAQPWMRFGLYLNAEAVGSVQWEAEGVQALGATHRTLKEPHHTGPRCGL